MVKFLGPQSPTDGSFNARTYGAKGDGTVDDAPAIQRAIDAASASTNGALPTFVAAGTVANGTGNVSPGVPAGYAANDIFLMFVESNFDQAVTAPAGWAAVDGFPQANTTNALASQLSAFWKRAAASESAPTVTDPGDHAVARIFGFRGCRTAGVPWDTVATTVTDSAGTTLTCPSVTTSVVNNLIVNVASSGVDGGASFGTWTNASLGSLTERGDNSVSDGGGGGFGVSTGTKAVPGASGTTTTVTSSTWSITGTIALAPVETPGGSVVVIPPGNYRLNSQLNLRSNQTLVAHGAYLWSGAANYLLVSNYGAWGFNGGRNIEVHGGIWDGKAQDQAAEAAYNVMGFYHCQNVGVHDVTIRNVASWHGFEFNSTNGGILERARFEGFRDTTAAQSRQFSASVQIDLGANDFTCSKNITIKDCYSGPSVDGSGLSFFGRGFDSHTDSLGKWYTGIKILNNTIEGTIQEGIQTYSWNDSIVTGNVITNSGKAGIKVAGNAANNVRNLTISNNVINSPGENGILLGAVGTRTITNSTISNNIVDNAGVSAGQPSIYLNYAQSSTVSTNAVTGGSNIGISLVNCNDSTVSGNVLTTTGHDGIRVGETSGALVSNNRIKDAAQAGIWLLGNSTTNNTICSNYISGSGTASASVPAMGMSNTSGGDNAFIGNRCSRGLLAAETRSTNGVLITAVSSGSGIAVVVGNSFKGYSATYGTAISDGRASMNDDIAGTATANNNAS